MSLIVFDLDGTLIDSRLDLANSTNEMLETYGVSPLRVDDVVAMVGEGARVLVKRALAAVELDVNLDEALTRFREIYDRRLFETTRPYEGIPEMVQAAAMRATLAVLTNKPSAPTGRLLEGFDLARHFQWTLGGDSPLPRKPDPAGLRFLMTQTAAPASATLMVGDSQIDVATARAAGVGLCIARYGFGWAIAETSLLPGDRVADTAAEIGRAIDDFLGGS